VVEGLDASKTIASGSVQAIVVVGGQVQKSVTLVPGAMPCGNGVVDPGEGCDDGNLFSYDGCDSRCQVEGSQTDAGSGPVDSATTVDAGDVFGAADALTDRSLVDIGEDASVQSDLPVDVATPDEPYVPDAALDLSGAGTGGTTGTGGIVGAGGTIGTGGMLGTGGATSTGGAVEIGGTTNNGGATGTGGNVGTGGLTSTGGLTGTGGLTSTGGNASGGTTGTGGGTGGSNLTPAGTPGQSCSSLPPNCGPYGTESCCASYLVPGGTFYRSYDGVDFTDKSFPATINDYALDRYEVTVGRFRAFVNAGKGTQANPPAAGDGAHPLIVGSGWDSTWNSSLVANTAALTTALKCDPGNSTWTNVPGAGENRPMNCLYWYEAFAFCAWDGGRLPTEAELNYAASGGSEQRYYPWSNPPTSTVIDGTYAVYSDSGTNARDVGSKSPKGDGKWGHADLGGNVWEKVLDWFESPYSRNICTNCTDLSAATYRAARGGGFLDLPRSADRGIDEPMYRNYDVGFRCARAK
jgi:cysteine-rich repeat protein